MKNVISISLFILLTFVGACKKPETTVDPKEKLQQLKVQIQELNTQVKQLEIEISKTDTSFVKTSKAKKVTIDSARKQDFKHFIETQGIVDAAQNVLAAPQMPGLITKIYVKEGDRVHAGQILAQMDGATMKQGIEEIKTAIAMANTMFDKQKSLWEQNIGSESQFLQAKNQKEQLEQKLKTLQSQLSMTNIKSPVNGIVDEIKVKIGEIASPGFAGIRVVNNSNLMIKARLSDQFASKVKKGDKVSLYFPDLDKELSSALSYVGQTVNASSRTINVEAKLPPAKEKFITNQIVKLKINDGIQKSVIVVPSNVIQKSINGEDYILVVENKNGIMYARKQIIKTGQQYNGQTVILEGLKSGDNYITLGYTEIVDGQTIQN